MTFALTHGNVTVRLLRVRDAKVLERLILGNREWLRPWEATNPFGPNSFDIKAMVKGLVRQLDDQSGLPCVIEFEGEVVGQLTVANILFGSVSSAVIGYWVVPEVAGKGVTPQLGFKVSLGQRIAQRRVRFVPCGPIFGTSLRCRRPFEVGQARIVACPHPDLVEHDAGFGAGVAQVDHLRVR